jgi:hypothetical protein
MEDFNALAAALGAGIQDVRGCLIVSRDGLVLGAHPVGMEGEAKHSWIRFASLGEPERSFVQFGTEVWCYVRRGPYAAFALTGTGVRPGLVIDHMEEVLLAAEESRARHSGLRIGGAEAAPLAPVGPRTALHPDPRPVDDVPVVRPEPPPPRPVSVSAPGTIAPAEARESTPPPERPPDPSGTRSEPPDRGREAEAPGARQGAPTQGVPAFGPSAAEHGAQLRPESRQDPRSEGDLRAEPSAEPPVGVPREPSPGTSDEPSDEPVARPPAPPAPDDDVDRFSLAREFSQLLQDERGSSDG